MLTNQLFYYYNHLLATTVLYFSIVDPLQEISNSLKQLSKDGNQNNLSRLFVDANKDLDENYYKILGLEKDATKHEIHKAFRQLAKKYHPDKNKDKGAQDEFIKIFKAYATLSDEKKRKEYDEAFERPNHGSFGGWQSSGMGDFDMNEFFKQYEDHFFRHTQHYSQDNHQDHHDSAHHDHFKFHGVNLDDLFHDIDTFGDGASFFGSHFPSQIHHQHSHSQSHSGYYCQTVTRQVDGMVMTHTSCD